MRTHFFSQKECTGVLIVQTMGLRGETVVVSGESEATLGSFLLPVELH